MKARRSVVVLLGHRVAGGVVVVGASGDAGPGLGHEVGDPCLGLGDGLLQPLDLLGVVGQRVGGRVVLGRGGAQVTGSFADPLPHGVRGATGPADAVGLGDEVVGHRPDVDRLLAQVVDPGAKVVGVAVHGVPSLGWPAGG